MRDRGRSFGTVCVAPPPLVYDASESDTAMSDMGGRRKQSVTENHGIQKISRNIIRCRTERWYKRRRDQRKDTPEPTYNLDSAIDPQAHTPIGGSSSDSSDMDLESLRKYLIEMTPNERLKHMRRPSTIVPDIRMGSRLEAGMTPENQEAFKRLVLATSFRMQSLDRRGHAQPMPKGQRSFYGLEHYSPRLVPPPTERFIRPVRVPRILLSVHHRGKGLKRRYTRNLNVKRRVRHHCKHDQSQPDRAGEPYNEKAVPSPLSEPSDYVADFDYWCPTSEFEEAERERVLKRAKEHAEATKVIERIVKEGARSEGNNSDPGSPTEKCTTPFSPEDPLLSKGVGFSKEDYVRRLLESKSDDEASMDGNSSSSSDSEQLHINEVAQTPESPPNELSTPEMQTSAPNLPMVYPYFPAPEHLEERQRKERIDEEIEEEDVDEGQKPHPLFDNLLSSVLENPDSVLKVPDMKKGVPLTIESGLLNPAGSNDENHDKEVKTQETVELSGYELEQSLAMAFCGRRTTSNPRTSQERKHRKRNREKSSTPSTGNAKRKDDSRQKEQLHVHSRGWEIMRRHGFSGLLGRRNGLAQPLEFRSRAVHRAGLGLDARKAAAVSQSRVGDNPVDNNERSSTHS